MTEFTAKFIEEAREMLQESEDTMICNPVQLEMLDEIERLQKENEEMRILLLEAVNLGEKQADEMDRYWNAIGLLDENISIDDAIKEYKNLQARITELEALVKQGHKMSEWAACINFDGSRNTKKWCDELYKEIDDFQNAVLREQVEEE